MPQTVDTQRFLDDLQTRSLDIRAELAAQWLTTLSPDELRVLRSHIPALHDPTAASVTNMARILAAPDEPHLNIVYRGERYARTPSEFAANRLPSITLACLEVASALFFERITRGMYLANAGAEIKVPINGNPLKLPGKRPSRQRCIPQAPFTDDPSLELLARERILLYSVQSLRPDADTIRTALTVTPREVHTRLTSYLEARKLPVTEIPSLALVVQALQQAAAFGAIAGFPFQTAQSAQPTTASDIADSPFFLIVDPLYFVSSRYSSLPTVFDPQQHEQPKVGSLETRSNPVWALLHHLGHSGPWGVFKVQNSATPTPGGPIAQAIEMGAVTLASDPTIGPSAWSSTTLTYNHAATALSLASARWVDALPPQYQHTSLIPPTWLEVDTLTSVAEGPDDPSTMDRTSDSAAARGLEAVQRMTEILGFMAQRPLRFRNKGGLHLADTRALMKHLNAARLPTTIDDLGFFIALAAVAGIVEEDLDRRGFVPTPYSDAWLTADAHEQWAVLQLAWMGSGYSRRTATDTEVEEIVPHAELVDPTSRDSLLYETRLAVMHTVASIRPDRATDDELAQAASWAAGDPEVTAPGGARRSGRARAASARGASSGGTVSTQHSRAAGEVVLPLEAIGRAVAYLFPTALTASIDGRRVDTVIHQMQLLGIVDTAAPTHQLLALLRLGPVPDPVPVRHILATSRRALLHIPTTATTIGNFDPAAPCPPVLTSDGTRPLAGSCTDPLVSAALEAEPTAPITAASIYPAVRRAYLDPTAPVPPIPEKRSGTTLDLLLCCQRLVPSGRAQLIVQSDFTITATSLLSGMERQVLLACANLESTGYAQVFRLSPEKLAQLNEALFTPHAADRADAVDGLRSSVAIARSIVAVRTDERGVTSAGSGGSATSAKSTGSASSAKSAGSAGRTKSARSATSAKPAGPAASETADAMQALDSLLIALSATFSRYAQGATAEELTAWLSDRTLGELPDTARSLIEQYPSGPNLEEVRTLADEAQQLVVELFHCLTPEQRATMPDSPEQLLAASTLPSPTTTRRASPHQPASEADQLTRAAHQPASEADQPVSATHQPTSNSHQPTQAPYNPADTALSSTERTNVFVRCLVRHTCLAQLNSYLVGSNDAPEDDILALWPVSRAVEALGAWPEDPDEDTGGPFPDSSGATRANPAGATVHTEPTTTHPTHTTTAALFPDLPARIASEHALSLTPLPAGFGWNPLPSGAAFDPTERLWKRVLGERGVQVKSLDWETAWAGSPWIAEVDTLAEAVAMHSRNRRFDPASNSPANVGIHLMPSVSDYGTTNDFVGARIRRFARLHTRAALGLSTCLDTAPVLPSGRVGSGPNGTASPPPRGIRFNSPSHTGHDAVLTGWVQRCWAPVAPEADVTDLHTVEQTVTMTHPRPAMLQLDDDAPWSTDPDVWLRWLQPQRTKHLFLMAIDNATFTDPACGYFARGVMPESTDSGARAALQHWEVVREGGTDNLAERLMPDDWATSGPASRGYKTWQSRYHKSIARAWGVPADVVEALPYRLGETVIPFRDLLTIRKRAGTLDQTFTASDYLAAEEQGDDIDSDIQLSSYYGTHVLPPAPHPAVSAHWLWAQVNLTSPSLPRRCTAESAATIAGMARMFQIFERYCGFQYSTLVEGEDVSAFGSWDWPTETFRWMTIGKEKVPLPPHRWLRATAEPSRNFTAWLRTHSGILDTLDPAITDALARITAGASRPAALAWLEDVLLRSHIADFAQASEGATVRTLVPIRRTGLLVEAIDFTTTDRVWVDLRTVRAMTLPLSLPWSSHYRQDRLAPMWET